MKATGKSPEMDVRQSVRKAKAMKAILIAVGVLVATLAAKADPVLQVQYLTNGFVKVTLACAINERYDLQTNSTPATNGWAIFDSENGYGSNIREYIFTTNSPAKFFRPVFRTMVVPIRIQP